MLLGSVVATIVLAVLAAFSILLPWVPLVGAAAVVGSFLFVRAGVRAEQAARRARRARARQRQTVRRSPASHRATEPVGARASHRSGSGGAAVDSGQLSDRGDLGDAELLERTEVTSEDEGRPDGWQPVPVPPPTYTLKAKAERPSPAVTADPATADAPVSAAEEASTRAADVVDASTVPATVAPADGEQPEHRTAAYGT